MRADGFIPGFVRPKELSFAISKIELAIGLQHRAQSVLDGMQRYQQMSAHNAFGQWKCEQCERAKLIVAKRILKWQSLHTQVESVSNLIGICETSERSKISKTLITWCSAVSENIYNCGVPQPDNLPLTPINFTVSLLEGRENRWVEETNKLETELKALILMMESAAIEGLTKKRESPLHRAELQEWKQSAQFMRAWGGKRYLTFSWHHLKDSFREHRRACVYAQECDHKLYSFCKTIFTRKFTKAVNDAQIDTLRRWKYRIVDLESFEEWIILLAYFVLRKDIPQKSLIVRLADVMNDCAECMRHHMSFSFPEYGSLGIYTCMLANTEKEEVEFAERVTKISASLDDIENELCCGYNALITEAFDHAISNGGAEIIALYSRIVLWEDAFSLPSSSIYESWKAAKIDILDALQKGDERLADMLINIATRRNKTAARFDSIYKVAEGARFVLAETLNTFTEETDS